MFLVLAEPHNLNAGGRGFIRWIIEWMIYYFSFLPFHCIRYICIVVTAKIILTIAETQKFGGCHWGLWTSPIKRERNMAPCIFHILCYLKWEEDAFLVGSWWVRTMFWWLGAGVGWTINHSINRSTMAWLIHAKCGCGLYRPSKYYVMKKPAGKCLWLKLICLMIMQWMSVADTESVATSSVTLE